MATEGKKMIWKKVIDVVITVLTAIATAFTTAANM